MIGSASTAQTTLAGTSRNAICRSRARPCCGSRRGRRATRGARATGRAPSRPRPRTSPAGACRCGTPASIARRREVGSMSRAAKSVSITALKLISPRPSVTGTISLKTCRTAGSRQSITSCRRAVAAAQPRQRQQHLDHGRRRGSRPRRRRASRRRVRAAGRRSTSPAMIARFQKTGVSAGIVKCVVAVEDPDDDPGDAEQRDDREEHAREADGERWSRRDRRTAR